MGVSFLLDEAINVAEERTASAAANTLGIRFSGLTGMLDGKDELFNNFIRNVVRQTEFCARAKNYAGPFIGIRDIFQQVEAAIAWIPEYCRSKVVEALNFIGENVRAPRQYSYPANEWSPDLAENGSSRVYRSGGVDYFYGVYLSLLYG